MHNRTKTRSGHVLMKVSAFCAVFFLSAAMSAAELYCSADHSKSFALLSGSDDYVRTQPAESSTLVYGEGEGVDFSFGFMPFFQSKTSANEIPKAFGYDKTLNCWLWGISLNVDYTPFVFSNTRFGLGYQSMYTYLKRSESYYSLSAHLLENELLLVWKIQTESSIVVELRAGGGCLMLYNLGYSYSEYETPKINKIFPNAAVGIGAQTFLTNHFFIDTSWNMSLVFMDDSSFFMLQPSVSAGWHL